MVVFDAKLVSNSHGSKKCDEFHLVWTLTHLFPLCDSDGYIALLLPIVGENDAGTASVCRRRREMVERGVDSGAGILLSPVCDDVVGP